MKKFYEWTLEVLDEETGDIIDSHYDDNLLSLASLGETFCLLDESNKLALICRTGDEITGEQSRSYFYLEDGKLQPDENGNEAPVSYQQEVDIVGSFLGFN